MTLKDILKSARSALTEGRVEDAPLECELLMMHALGISRVQLYLDLDLDLDPQRVQTFWRLVQRRLNREPTAYITGHREFYGLDFYVTPSVLIPRPETELLVEKSLDFARSYNVSAIADIGTGCGAIAISLALNLPETTVYATDISALALEVASFNAREHRLANRIQFLQGNLLEPLPEAVALIVTNLPYVNEAELAERAAANFEPELALNGGADGLSKINELCRQLSGKLRSGGCLLLEIGQGQCEAVVGLLRSLFPAARLEVYPDLAGIDRVVSLRLE